MTRCLVGDGLIPWARVVKLPVYPFPWIHDTNGLTRSGSRIRGYLPHTRDIYTESLNSGIAKLTEDGDGSKKPVLGNDVDIYLTEAITTLEQIILLLQ